MPNLENFIIPISKQSLGGGVGSVTIDAATERVIFVGKIRGHNWTSGSKSIQMLDFGVGARTAGTGTTFRVYLADLDSGSIGVARDDLIVDQYWETGSVAGFTVYINEPSAGLVRTGNLNSNRTVNIGDTVCVVFDYSTFGSSTSLALRTTSMGISAPFAFPTVTSFLSSAYLGVANGIPSVGFIFSDGSRGYFDGTLGVYLGNGLATFSTSSAGSSTSLDSGDERGLEWQPSKNWKLTGVDYGVRFDTSQSYVEFVTYSGSTAIHTSVANTNQVPLTSSALYSTTYASPISFFSGSTYRFTVKPSSSATVRLAVYDFGNTEDMQNLSAGGENVRYCTLTDGVLNTPTSASYRWPYILLRGSEFTNEEYLSGSFVISGSVTNGGLPISGAVIRLTRQIDNKTISTSSNATGKYQFNVPSGSSYHVMVEYETGSVKYNALSNWSISPV